MSQPFAIEWCLRPPVDMARLIQLRRQMLVHSFMYYHLDETLITDHQWQDRANELTQLQEKYGWRHHFYDEYFEQWDGSTGFHLPRDIQIENVTRRLLAYAERRSAK